MRESFFARYITDVDTETVIFLHFSKDPATITKGVLITKTPLERLKEGGLESSNVFSCYPRIGRRYFIPRNLVIAEFGRVWFRTHDLWTKYLKENAKRVISANGEKYTRKSLALFLGD